MRRDTIQAPAVEVQRRTPEVMRRIEERCVGLLPRVEAKMKILSGRDRRPEARLVDQAAQAGTVGTQTASSMARPMNQRNRRLYWVCSMSWRSERTL